MDSKNKTKKSFYGSIALMMIFLVVTLLIIFIVVSQTHIRNIYEEEYNNRVLNINKMLAQQLDGDKMEHYVSTKEIDQYYYEMLRNMYRLKNVFDVEYLYVMAQDFTKDYEEFIYILDVNIDEDPELSTNNIGEEIDPEDFPGAKEVLSTGIGFEKALYYEGEEYGKLYYAYTPIFNSEGKAVAVLGTDVDASPMLETIKQFQIKLILISTLLSILALTLILLYGKLKFSKPILKLSNDIAKFSKGDLDIEISKDLMEREDELGLMYRGFDEVSQIIRAFMNDTNYVSQEASRGNLSARIEKKELYLGAFEKVRENSNKMLDKICSLLDMMPNEVILYDNTFKELYCNNPAKLTLNYHESEIHKKQVQNIELLSKHTKEIEKAYNNFLASGQRSFSSMFSIEDEKKHYFDSFFIKIESNGGESGICAVYTDVSEYMEMSEKAEASNQAKSEFLSRMSHEMRTPLNAIVGITEITKRQTTEEEIIKNLTTIEKSSEHLLTIINDVLDISKIESGDIELTYDSFSLESMIKNIFSILEHFAVEKKIELTFELTGKNINNSILGDEARLRQVLINLISNGIKFSNSNSKVIVAINELNTDRDKYVSVKFSIKDFGIGINKDNQSSIFEAFEQGSLKISREYGGAGLGLSISNKVIHLMGGEGIQLKSEINKGSEFYFILDFEMPEQEEKDISNSIIDIDEISLSGIKILLVDDIEINREIVISMLDGTGAIIDTADDGTTALEKYLTSSEGYYNLILMDIQMRVMDGYTATKKIRESNRSDSNQVAIIAMSANAYQKDKDKGKKVGMNEYITKPVDFIILMETILRYCVGQSPTQ